VFKWEPRVWVVGFGLVDSLALVPFNLHISFHLFCLVVYSWINPQTFGTRLKWSWLNKTLIFDHFPVGSTSHLHTLNCKRFVRLRILIKTHIKHHKEILDPISPKKKVVLWQLSIGCTSITKAKMQSKWPKYININPTHRHNRIFMHTISIEYPNKYSNILKAQKLKRITEDTMKIMGWEEMCKECQNLGRNPWEKHTTCHDKNAKMCVWQRKRRKS
jgi:hypothetical protein